MKLLEDLFMVTPRTSRGFTLIEVMIAVFIVTVGVVLAAPSFSEAIQRRQLSAGAEEISALLTYAQSEAVKRNEAITVSWYTPGEHSEQWCIGIIEGDTPCDCRKTAPGDANYCAVDGVPYRLQQTDFVDINFEFMHMNPPVGSFAFDPVRGIMTNVSSTEVLDGDWLFYLHSNEGSGATRAYELEIWASITGRVSICADTYRKSIIGGYPEC